MKKWIITCNECGKETHIPQNKNFNDKCFHCKSNNTGYYEVTQ